MQAPPEDINKEPGSPYFVQRLSRRGLDDLSTLYAEVYGRAAPAGFFIKKYDTAFTGAEYVGYIAYNSDNKPVAYYGVIPCFISFNNGAFLSAQSADTMTHPGHRYKGMFVDLSKKTFELCRQLGIRLIFGFPNQNSYHGAINKLGWQITETMSYFSIPAKAFPLAVIAKKLTFLNRLYDRYSRNVIKKLALPESGVSNSVIAGGFAGVLRNPVYIKYKSYSPSYVIGIAGVKAWISIKDSIWIGDIENITEHNFQQAINAIKKLAGRLGIKKIQFHCSPGTRLHNLFEMYSPANPSYPVLFQNFESPVPPEKVKFTFADIDIF